MIMDVGAGVGGGARIDFFGHAVLGNVSSSSLIGVGIACGGNVLISLALNVQKLAHRRNAEQHSLSTSHSPRESSPGNANVNPSTTDPTSPTTASRSGSRSTSGSTTPTLQENASPTPLPQAKARGRGKGSSASGSRGQSHDVLGVGNGAPSYADVVKGEELPLRPEPEPEGETTAVQTVQTVQAVPVVIVPSGSQASSSLLPPAGEDSSDQQHAHETDTDQSRGRARSPSRLPIPVPIAIPPKILHVQLDSPPTPARQLNGHQPTMDASNDTSAAKAKANGAKNEQTDGNGNGEMEEMEEGMYLRSKLWWFGMVLIAIGEGGNFLSYGFAPASVVAPLGTVALIANCVFAPLILREKFYKRELLGMALAVLGAVTVVWSSNSTNPRLDPPSLRRALVQLPFLIYTLLNVVFLVPLLLLSRSSYGATYIVIDVGICALFGGYTVLSTKALSSLLSTMFLDAFGYWITWGLVAVVAGTSVGQIRWLNRALMRFQSKEVIPTQFVFFSLAAIIGSAVLFQEFRDVPFSHFVNFAFGIGTTFLGVYLLTSSSDSDNPESSDANDDSSDEAETDDAPLSHRAAPAPKQPQRAPSSASINLLLPSSISLPSERTPLLYTSPRARSGADFTPSSAATSKSVRVRRPSNLPTISGGLPFVPGSLSRPAQALAPGPGQRIRLTSRASTDFPTLGLGSQAGFLLMATTPPTHSSPPPPPSLSLGIQTGLDGVLTRRERSSSRSRDRDRDRDRDRTHTASTTGWTNTVAGPTSTSTSIGQRWDEAPSDA